MKKLGSVACIAGVAGVALLGGVAISSLARSAPALLGSTSKTWEEIEGGGDARGTYRGVFRSPTATLDELEMHVTHLPPGKEPHPPHKHQAEEMLIIREGTLEAMQNGKTRKVGPGSVIFQASNQLHGVKNVGSTTATYYVIRWASPAATPRPAAAR